MTRGALDRHHGLRCRCRLHRLRLALLLEGPTRLQLTLQLCQPHRLDRINSGQRFESRNTFTRRGPYSTSIRPRVSSSLTAGATSFSVTRWSARSRCSSPMRCCRRRSLARSQRTLCARSGAARQRPVSLHDPSLSSLRLLKPRSVNRFCRLPRVPATTRCTAAGQRSGQQHHRDRDDDRRWPAAESVPPEPPVVNVRARRWRSLHCWCAPRARRGRAGPRRPACHPHIICFLGPSKLRTLRRDRVTAVIEHICKFSFSCFVC